MKEAKMLETLKSILLDSQESELNPGVQRDVHITSIQGKATVCIGVRRSGKSTLMVQVMTKLIESGVQRKNIVSINFADDRLHALQHDNLDIIIKAYYSMFPEKKNAEKVYFFFDEIQMVPGWESFIERILRTENCEVYITGSSANMLSKEIASQLRGRALSWELFPFSFKEYLRWKEIEHQEPLSSKKIFFIQNAFGEYLEKGRFPEVRDLAKELRIKIHQEYFHAILLRDLIERHDIAHPKAVSDLAYWLVDNVGSSYSINKLFGYLQALGHKISKEEISSYLEWFEDAYFFFSVRLFDASTRRSQLNPKKVYCIDHAFIPSISSGVLLNSGHLLENLVFMSLRSNFPSIYYYKTKSGREVDFLAQNQRTSRAIVQACETLHDQSTKKREILALQEAMEELHLPSATIVTKDEEETISVSSGTISIVPIWKFLLFDSSQNFLS